MNVLRRFYDEVLGEIVKGLMETLIVHGVLVNLFASLWWLMESVKQWVPSWNFNLYAWLPWKPNPAMGNECALPCDPKVEDGEKEPGKQDEVGSLVDRYMHAQGCDNL